MISKNDKRLIMLYLDGSLSDDAFATFQQRLREDAEVRESLRTEMNLDTALRDIAAADSSLGQLWEDTKREDSELDRRFCLPRLVEVLMLHRMAALILLVFGFLAIGFWISNQPKPTDVVVTLIENRGRVAIVDPVGHQRAVNAGARIVSGDKIKSDGDNSFAIIAFDDGSRFHIVGQSSLELASTQPKRMTLLSGTISAKVAPQPPGHPLVIVTPNDSIEVLGTEFVLEASSEHTDIHVQSGEVRLVRTTDSQQVLLSQGDRVVSDNVGSDLVVRNRWSVSGTWSADFEQGVPDDWRRGEIIRTDLPLGSKGAIQNAYEARWNSYMIDSPKRWVEGLFAVTADSHIRFTFKMDEPGWINIFLQTRTDDESDPTDMYQCNSAPFATAEPGKWYTMTIPLALWARNDDTTGEGFIGPPPTAGEIVVAMSWSSRNVDRGLVIDRVWVTADGLGKIEMTGFE